MPLLELAVQNYFHKILHQFVHYYTALTEWNCPSVCLVRDHTSKTEECNKFKSVKIFSVRPVRQ